ncbi:MAG: four helix bundle protein [Bacillota bacterium]
MKNDLPERTFQFAVDIVNLCRLLDKNPGVSRTLANQLLRSGPSIGANVQEGQASQSEADFLTKYSIACKEAQETQYWLRIKFSLGILKISFPVSPLTLDNFHLVRGLMVFRCGSIVGLAFNCLLPPNIL